MTEAGHRISGGYRTEETDMVYIQHWILRYREASSELQQIITSLKKWLVNDHSPCAAYRTFMAGRLIGIDKLPGVKSVWIG